MKNNKNLFHGSLPPLQNIASAWHGPDMMQRTNEWVINLTDSEIYELENAAGQWINNENVASLLSEPFLLPTLGARLLQWRNDLINGKGFLLLKGLPVSKYTEKEAGSIFLGLGTHLGSPRSQNAKGHVFWPRKDLGYKSSDPNTRIYQTSERQTFHTDSCDVVGLLCLKKAKSGGDSLLVSASTIYNEMYHQRPDLLELLLQPIATDRRGEVPEGQLPYLLIPVFSFYREYLTPFYQRQYIESAQRFEGAPELTPRHFEALDLFDKLANDEKLNLSMSLEPGDMQFVYNHALLHDRTAFVDQEETAEKRHLLRLWLSVPGDRPLPEIFATRFGSVEPGNRGGIIVPGSELNIPWS